MNRFLTAAAAIGVLGSTAFGQSTSRKFDLTPYNYSFRAGAAFLSDGSISSGDNSWFNLGVDFDFNTSILKMGESFLSGDVLMDQSADNSFLFTILLNNRFYLSEEDKRLFLIGGLGAIYADFSTDDTVFAARIGLGFHMSDHMFLSGTYTFGNKLTGDIDPSYTSFCLGYRF